MTTEEGITNDFNLSGELYNRGNEDAAIKPISDAANRIRQEISKLIVGQDDLLTQLITGLFTGGHLLVEGVPGIAKTLSAKMLAQTLRLKYTRIQFTPDLMPSDVTGTSVFNLKTSEFTFNKGPVFSQIVLIDEINRAPAKTQSALFEVMEEGQVSVDGETYLMDQPFMVLATQNPIEQEGTYRLPEAQLDRFLFRIRIAYPDLHEELEILKRFRDETSASMAGLVQSVLEGVDVLQLRKLVSGVLIKDELLEYIAKVVDQTRHDADLFLGASPRASIALMRSAKALAAIRGRSYVVPDDVKDMAYPVLNHRIQVNPEREMEGLDSNQVIKRILESIEIPR
jgi:MoxR-like ATPase